jgi:hypothetical protein
MNVMDRSFSVRAEQAKAKQRAARERRRMFALAIAAALIVLGAAFYVVWSFTLCGDCGAPGLLPPPPA